MNAESKVACVILTTWSSKHGSCEENFIKPLLHEHLIACANVSAPMKSIYVWNGELCEDEERQIVMKTTRERVCLVEARMNTLHPYECPGAGFALLREDFFLFFPFHFRVFGGRGICIASVSAISRDQDTVTFLNLQNCIVIVIKSHLSSWLHHWRL